MFGFRKHEKTCSHFKPSGEPSTSSPAYIRAEQQRARQRQKAIDEANARARAEMKKKPVRMPTEKEVKEFKAKYKRPGPEKRYKR